MSTSSTETSSTSSDDKVVDLLGQSVYLIKLGDENYEASLKIAEQYKESGNKLLKENKFQEAVDKYTNAIDLKIETPNNAVYYSNRAFANIRLENLGLTLSDANEAIKINPNYYKAYYRRASAQLILGHLDEALKDLEFLQTKFPNDKDLLEKIKQTKIQRKKKRFWEAMSSEGREAGGASISLDTAIKTLKIDESYSGIKMPDDLKISEEWIVKVIEDMKNRKFIHKKYLAQIIRKAKEHFEKQESLIDINIPKDGHFTVCGDIHGQFYDLLNIFKINGFPSDKNPYLFNGDFVDRGVFSVECIITLLLFKVLYPNNFYMSRGNHEGRNMNKIYGFEREVVDKYDSQSYEWFIELFKVLPLAHVINKKILVVHGGLFSVDGVKLEDIKKIDRNQDIPEKGLMAEILWSDPSKEKGRLPSKRGMGMSFGPDIACKFLDDNGLDLLIRSHEVKPEGYEIEPCQRVVTVFSAPNYCDQMGNKGAFAKIKGDDLKPVYVSFEAVEHPKIPITKYMNTWMF